MSEAHPGPASASERPGDGVRGRSPREEQSEAHAGPASASERPGDGVRGRSPREAQSEAHAGPASASERPRDVILSLRDLSVSFRTGSGSVAAVRELTLDVPRGSTVAVVGESGSGKSTTASAINRLLPGNGRIDSGEVWFEGRDLLRLGESEMRAVRGAQIGLVPQDPMSNLNPLMRIGDQIAEALEVHGLASRATASKAVVELLDMVGIADAAQRVHQFPHEFSGGMRQRVLIAIGLACRPRLLIADEPTSALDVTVQRRILDRLAALTAEMGTSVFLITHDLGLAAERADEIAVMFQGAIVEHGPAASILEDPQHDYTRTLMQAAPSLSSRRMVAVTGGDAVAPGEAAAAPIVEVRDLVKSFSLRGRGRRRASSMVAVDSVSFRIPRRATVSIVGESGSGKSTTANVVLGLETATSGTVVFDGDDIANDEQVSAARVPAPRATGVPEPLRLARSAVLGGAFDRRAAARARRRDGA